MSLLSQARRTIRQREDAQLNLIPLIDILSVLVAFLLVYSTEVEVVQNSKGVEIPQSSAQSLPKQSVVVMITKEHLFVQGELIADISTVRDSQSPQIEALREVLARPMVNARSVSGSTLASREITVLADRSLPYELVKKVMTTCTAAAFSKVSLAVIEKEKPVDLARLSPV
jgi:biopolymer transport protein TolR